ncbi:MAG: hypothetical protein WCL04_07340 [Verrucomicrobiota bacterium]
MSTPFAAPDPLPMDPPSEAQQRAAAARLRATRLGQLGSHLQTVASSLRSTRLHRLAMWRWLAVAAIAVG